MTPGPLDEARNHLAKALEFLAAAEHSLASGRTNAATSDAVLSGINAKDAIVLVLTGRTEKTRSHEDAVAHLRAAGGSARPLASVMRRLVQLKPKSQYQSASMSTTDATKAVGWARRLCDEAKSIASSR